MSTSGRHVASAVRTCQIADVVLKPHDDVQPTLQPPQNNLITPYTAIKLPYNRQFLHQGADVQDQDPAAPSGEALEAVVRDMFAGPLFWKFTLSCSVGEIPMHGT